MKSVAILLLACFALLVSACGVVNPEITPFYAPPDPLPEGKPGDIIKTEKIETNNAAVQAWRVMYLSRDLRGDPIAVTGIFAAPTAAPPDGGFPLLAIAHGTEGLAQKCAPSLDPWGVPSFAGDYLSFPDTTIVPFVQAGYAVTATDYQGLGTPGTSSFLVGPAEAQSVIDSVRALRHFDEVDLNDLNFIWGHSQGGHSIAFTAQLLQELAPEIKLNGIILAAPAAQLQTLVETVLKPNQPSPVTGVAAMVAASWNQAYDLQLDTVLTRTGIEKIPGLLQECVLGSIASFAIQRPSDFYFADPTVTAPWSDVMNANTPKPVRYPAPVFVAQGASDNVIAPQATEQFVNALCAAGNAVQYNLYPNTDHLAVVKSSHSDVLTWLTARIAGDAPPSTCPASPVVATLVAPTPIPPTLVAPTPIAPTALPQAFDHVILTDGAFTPDAATIAELESLLPAFLTQNQNKFSALRDPIVERLPNYKLQYWGELTNDKRVVYLNALCTPLDGWQTQRVLVLDGGDCFFNLEYDPATKTFSRLSVNGEA